MTIQRQYSLPNCTLVLEGLSAGNVTPPAMRPSLDVLIRFECRIVGMPEPLIGGKDLLTALLYAVNQALQEWLSGVPRLQSLRTHPESQGILIQALPDDCFRLHLPQTLLLQPYFSQAQPKDQEDEATGTAIEFELSLVQMFDLLEALDQLCADSQTLPDVSAQLQSLPRRSTKPGSSLDKQAKPLTLGMGSLAVAATVFFLIPVPKVAPPEPTAPTPQQTSLDPQQSAVPSPPSPVPPTSPSPTPSALVSAQPQPSPTATPNPTATPSPSPLSLSLATVDFPSGLTVRANPSSNSARIGGVDFKEQVEVLAESPDREWQRIRSRQSGVEGWVKAANLAPVKQNP
jgi:outer membrane biosynthesis protein TonB